MPRRRRLSRWLLAGIVAVAAIPAWGQLDLLPPELAAKLTPDGEAARFRNGAERWEEAMPPGIVDVDRDGTKDYIVLILADETSSRRALLARVWGDSADSFGPTVFYVIIEDDNTVAEWAGTPRLTAPARPKP
jgi:hypothetical protein